jgi:hypothetical protein
VELRWTKGPEGSLTSTVGTRTARIETRRDGRLAWSITQAEARSAMATGVANSLGAAKTTVEQFMMRFEER